MARSAARRAPGRDVAALLAVLAAVVVIALTPRGFWPVAVGWPLSWLQVAGAIGALAAVVASRLPLRTLAWRWLAFAPLVTLPALSLALATGFTDAAWREFFSQTLKGYACFTWVLALLSALGFQRLLAALERLGAPRVLIATLAFMERYREVLLDELHRARRARQARAFHRNWRQELRQAGALAGVTILRAAERAQRVHAAMLARGYVDGRW